MFTMRKLQHKYLYSKRKKSDGGSVVSDTRLVISSAGAAYPSLLNFKSELAFERIIYFMGLKS